MIALENLAALPAVAGASWAVLAARAPRRVVAVLDPPAPPLEEGPDLLDILSAVLADALADALAGDRHDAVPAELDEDGIDCAEGLAAAVAALAGASAGLGDLHVTMGRLGLLPYAEGLHDVAALEPAALPATEGGAR